MPMSPPEVPVHRIDASASLTFVRDKQSVIAFAAIFPTAGLYRLYLQFRHEGGVRTVEFTVEVQR